jgi:integrase
LLATAVFTGLRLSELLGLSWADVEFESAVVRVRKQLAKDGSRVEPKTPQALRAVVLMPALGRVLRSVKEQAFGLGHAGPADFVFASTTGGPMHVRNVARRGLARAVEIAGLDSDGKPRLRFHDLRHCFASLLISGGADVVFVSRQLGHANPSITLMVYSHLFDAARHAERTSAMLEQAFGAIVDGTAVETTTREQRQLAAFPAPATEPQKVALLRG